MCKDVSSFSLKNMPLWGCVKIEVISSYEAVNQSAADEIDGQMH